MIFFYHSIPYQSTKCLKRHKTKCVYYILCSLHYLIHNLESLSPLLFNRKSLFPSLSKLKIIVFYFSLLKMPLQETLHQFKTNKPKKKRASFSSTYLLIILDKGTKFSAICANFLILKKVECITSIFFFFASWRLFYPLFSCLIYKVILKFHFPISLPLGNFQLNLTPIHWSSIMNQRLY